MDQNQAINNQTVDNDLQKAIDNITNTTNIDPVFSDPIAAPSSVPEGDTGELGEPVGPFPEPKVEMVAPAPEAIAPLESMNIPELNNLEIPTPPVPPMPDLPTPESTAEQSEQPAEAHPVIEQPAVDTAPEAMNTSEIKKAALRDLVPLVDKINMDSSQKFKLYQNIFEDLKDYTVLSPAYQAARNIQNETERANALLYLVESIDKM